MGNRSERRGNGLRALGGNVTTEPTDRARRLGNGLLRAQAEQERQRKVSAGIVAARLAVGEFSAPRPQDSLIARLRRSVS